MTREPPKHDWTELEPGWAEFVSDVRRLYRRNQARPVPFLICVLLCTLYGWWRGHNYRPVYEARIAMRMTEQDVGVVGGPRPAAALRAFIADVVFSDRCLIRVMERFGLYARQRARGVDQALEALREDIGIEVWRNEFIIDDNQDPIGRSARVALSFPHPDPDIAYGVVSALADATIAEQRRMRMAQVEHLARGLEPAIEATRQQLNELKLQRARLDPALPLPPLPGAPLPQGNPLLDRPARLPPSWQTALQPWTSPLGLPLGPQSFTPAASRMEEIALLEGRLRELIERRGEADLRLRAETRDLALRSEIIDVVRPQRRPYHGMAVTLGVIGGLLGGLLMGGLLMRAFDRRLYEEQDVLRLGLPVCGLIPAYPGDDVGSMKSRARMTSR